MALHRPPHLTCPGITCVFFFLSYIILLKSKHGYLRKTPEMGLEDGVYSAFLEANEIDLLSMEVLLSVNEE